MQYTIKAGILYKTKTFSLMESQISICLSGTRYNAAAKQSLSQPVGCQLPLRKGAFAPSHFIKKDACTAPNQSAVQASINLRCYSPSRTSRFLTADFVMPAAGR